MNEPFVAVRDDGLWGVWHHKSVYPWQLPGATGKTREEAIQNYEKYMGKQEALAHARIMEYANQLLYKDYLAALNIWNLEYQALMNRKPKPPRIEINQDYWT